MFHSLHADAAFETKFVRRVQEQNPAVDLASYIDFRRRAGDKPGAR
jgi:hypothetical protein